MQPCVLNEAKIYDVTADVYMIEHALESYLLYEVGQCGIGHSCSIMCAGSSPQLIQDHQGVGCGQPHDL